MCINKFFHRFGDRKQNILLGVIHNTRESLDMVNFLIENYNFKNYFLELNECNKSFILKNNIFTCEFFPILNKYKNSNKKFKAIETREESIIRKNRIKFIDISFEAEIIIFSKIRDNFTPDSKIDIFENYINFKLSKYIFYKIWNFDNLKIGNSFIDFNKIIKLLNFYQSHILFREFMILYQIKQYMESESKDKFLRNPENEERIKNYFAKNFEFFKKEAENYIDNNEKSQPFDELLNKNSFCNSHKKLDSNHKQENELLIVIGQYHFDNFISQKLI